MENWELYTAILFVFLYVKAAKRRLEENSTHTEMEHTNLICTNLFFPCFFNFISIITVLFLPHLSYLRFTL
jgi:hypothetical protein